MTAFKLWQRWDPRLGPPPLRAALRFKQWVIEVVPDIFAPGNEALRGKVIHTIAAVKDPYKGRWLLRTAHPGEAVATLRRLHERNEGSIGRTPMSEVPSRVVLAVYAETQAELDARVAELRAPRVMAERLALTDMDAAIALARKEGVISDYNKLEIDAARAVGPDALSPFLRGRYYTGRRTACLGPDSGGLAVYLSPRAPIDISAAIVPPPPKVYRSDMLIPDVDDHPIDWVIVAGQIGPLGGHKSDPWPIHPRWITDIEVTSRKAEIPFCVPHLGEWACYDYRSWDGDHTVTSGMSSNVAMKGFPAREVDYDETWAWGQRGWDNEHPFTKPSSAYMQAVGSQLVGRSLLGRVFDEWPQWIRR